MAGHFDDGTVLPGLNEPWLFLGANAMEWCVGLVVFLIVGQVGDNSPAVMMPLMIVSWLATTITLSSIRKTCPDEERGVRNVVLTSLGFPPPDIPAPASIQAIWSGAPLRTIPGHWKFAQLGLDALLPSFEDDYLEADELDGGIRG